MRFDRADVCPLIVSAARAFCGAAAGRWRFERPRLIKRCRRAIRRLLEGWIDVSGCRPSSATRQMRPQRNQACDPWGRRRTIAALTWSTNATLIANVASGSQPEPHKRGRLTTLTSPPRRIEQHMFAHITADGRFLEFNVGDWSMLVGGFTLVGLLVWLI